MTMIIGLRYSKKIAMRGQLADSRTKRRSKVDLEKVKKSYILKKVGWIGGFGNIDEQEFSRALVKLVSGKPRAAAHLSTARRF